MKLISQFSKTKIAFIFVSFVFFLPLFSNVVYARIYGEGSYGSDYYAGDRTLSPSGAEECKDQAPGDRAPFIYSAFADSSKSISIHFYEGEDPIDYYSIEYGTSTGDYEWSGINVVGKGVGEYTVKELSPKTTYFFRIRGANGCAVGNWSNEISASTNVGKLKIIDSTLEGSGDEEKSDETTVEKYNLKVVVLDKNGQPIKNAKVVIYLETLKL